MSTAWVAAAMARPTCADRCMWWVPTSTSWTATTTASAAKARLRLAGLRVGRWGVVRSPHHLASSHTPERVDSEQHTPADAPLKAPTEVLSTALGPEAAGRQQGR